MIRYERTSDGLWTAHSDVRVGVEALALQVPLGRWDAGDPDPAGLRQAPVVLLEDDGRTSLALAGALRAGGMPPALVLPAEAPTLGAQLLLAVEERVEVVLLEGASGAHATLVRALAGRPVPALPLSRPEGLARLFDACEVDVNVPVPSLEGDEREAVRLRLADLHLEDVHHVVEVDPRPAYEELGEPMELSDLDGLGAAAAGVLAGRLAAANRRWRAEA